MAGTGGGNEQRQSIIIVAVLVGLGVILTVGARVEQPRRASTEAVASAPTTATTAPGPSSTTTTIAFGPAGVAYVDPNEIYRMTLGTDWAKARPGVQPVTWTAPVAGGTARVNPLLTRGAAPTRPPVRAVDRHPTRQRPLYRTTGTEPTTMADGTPATIVHYESSTASCSSAVRSWWSRASGA
jgi:hypothetical protein